MARCGEGSRLWQKPNSTVFTTAWHDGYGKMWPKWQIWKGKPTAQKPSPQLPAGVSPRRRLRPTVHFPPLSLSLSLSLSRFAPALSQLPCWSRVASTSSGWADGRAGKRAEQPSRAEPTTRPRLYSSVAVFGSIFSSTCETRSLKLKDVSNGSIL